MFNTSTLQALSAMEEGISSADASIVPKAYDAFGCGERAIYGGQYAEYRKKVKALVPMVY